MYSKLLHNVLKTAKTLVLYYMVSKAPFDTAAAADKFKLNVYSLNKW